jgi:hypothetical protein
LVIAGTRGDDNRGVVVVAEMKTMNVRQAIVRRVNGINDEGVVIERVFLSWFSAPTSCA